jgi:transposase
MEGPMRVVYDRCCGVDVHKKTVVACVVTQEGQEVRTFGTMTDELLALVDWLRLQQVGAVAMESTGVYWKPLYNLLEPEGFELLVVNASHMKAVPGRKTDVKDAEWIADLLRHGLLRSSFIPDRPQRELAELVRYRRSLIEERAREANRIQKVLEGANIKLASVISNVLGISGRAMLEAMVAGTEDPVDLAAKATTSIRATPEQLEAALRGVVGQHQRLLLKTQLCHIDFLEEQIAQLDHEIEERLRPFEQHVEHLDSIPGVGIRTAQEIVAAIGTDMSRFPSHRHLASWAKLCPGMKESAGKRTSARIGKGNAHLRVALVEAAQAASRTKNTYLAALYHRIAARRGRQRAVIAVAHTILVIAYHLLKDGTVYTDLGKDYFDQRDKDAIIKRQVKRLETLGCTVHVEVAA